MESKHSKRLKKAWITRRKNGDVIPHNKVITPSKDKLVDLYVKQKKSTYFIAKKYKVSTTPVKRWLNEYGIKLRDNSEQACITLNGFEQEEKHLNWKGDDVGYQALHTWVRKYKGTPKKCEHCGRTDKKKYEWANVDHLYNRNLCDYVRLCTKCHRQFDKENNLS